MAIESLGKYMDDPFGGLSAKAMQRVKIFASCILAGILSFIAQNILAEPPSEKVSADELIGNTIIYITDSTSETVHGLPDKIGQVVSGMPGFGDIIAGIPLLPGPKITPQNPDGPPSLEPTDIYSTPIAYVSGQPMPSSVKPSYPPVGGKPTYPPVGGKPTSIPNLPTKPPQFPTSPPGYPTSPAFPTDDIQPTAKPGQPSNTPKPTSPPKPTKTPKPTLITLAKTRPGKNWNDIFAMVSPLFCVPEGLLYGILQNEYGAWLGNVEGDWTNRNTFGWWGSQDDPRDNQGSQAIDSKVVMQMMDDTWWRIKTSGIMEKKLGEGDKSIMVTFDSIAASAWHLWNTSLYREKNCTSWPVKYIAKAACRYQGNCSNTYCNNVCERYNTYGKSGKVNCAQIPQVIDIYSCEFK
jgi:hypothetical protein